MTRRTCAAVVVIIALMVGGAALAANVGEMVLKTVAVGAVVNAVAKPANTGINRLVGLHNLPPGVSTKVIPVLSVGEKGYVGAAQVAGSQSLVLFFGWVLAGVLWGLPVPFMGWFTALVLTILVIVLWIMGMIYALVGDWKHLPVAGEIAAKLNI